MLQRADFPFSIQKCDAWGGLKGIWGGGGLVVRFKWIALSLVVPSPKHYNALASDLHLSGAPNTGAGQGMLTVVLSTKPVCVPRTAQRLDNCRPNVQSTLIETSCVCDTALILTALSRPRACCILLFMFACLCSRTFPPSYVKRTEVPSWFRC